MANNISNQYIFSSAYRPLAGNRERAKRVRGGIRPWGGGRPRRLLRSGRYPARVLAAPSIQNNSGCAQGPADPPVRRSELR